jgi:pimeloyl-ACP methyl ester carboxylesterase
MTEPTRKIPAPTVDKDGSLVAHTVATPKAFKIRALLEVPPDKVVPVVFIPGIMGTNLRLRADTKQSTIETKPGDPVWRPPNGAFDGMSEVWKWGRREPSQRQLLLDAEAVEVDPTGELPASPLTEQQMREQGWGEVHSGSYGTFLATIQQYLETTFELAGTQRRIKEHWRAVMSCEPARWGVRSVAPLTEHELEHYAGYYYPVYAIGYNWLQSCAQSADLVQKRVLEIIRHWRSLHRDCKQVILITHSMGGLVARACAKQIPDQIAGVVHGVMPAFGAPVAYRRIACGTEGARFEQGLASSMADDGFARIAGATAEETTPVMAHAPGVMELLPNQFYPPGWLVIRTQSSVNNEVRYRDLLALPKGNPYDFYRDIKSWYRMIDPALADPVGKYTRSPNSLMATIGRAIDKAERLHTQILMETGGAELSQAPGPAARDDKPKPVNAYYHPMTYAFYEADDAHRAFGQVRWVAQEPTGVGAVLTPNNVQQGRLVQREHDGSREVEVEGKYRLRFRPWLQDAPGDDTVPIQSAAGPAGHVEQIFRTGGYTHQESYQHQDVLLLTQYLIAKIAQRFK